MSICLIKTRKKKKRKLVRYIYYLVNPSKLSSENNSIINKSEANYVNDEINKLKKEINKDKTSRFLKDENDSKYILIFS